MEAGFPNVLHMGPTLGMIPCTIDVDSGSLKAAEKRRKNSCALKRFRQRKKAGEMEQKLKLETQAQEIRFLIEERDYYRTERNFYRDLINRVSDRAKIPPRPLSPRHRQLPPLATEPEGEQI